jgi:hypothetical protein
MDAEEAALDIIVPVLEAAMIYASHYCRACGRSTITAKDVEYGMKHAAMTTVGKHLGTHFPEDDEEQSSSDEDSVEVVDDTDEQFTVYSGEDDTCIKMNESFDIWESWEPQCAAEHAIKNAIDKQQTDGRVHP